ncbi:MAG: hypothetical protein ACYSUD_16255, partial [Planctomycetota bacterium]
MGSPQGRAKPGQSVAPALRLVAEPPAGNRPESPLGFSAQIFVVRAEGVDERFERGATPEETV